MAKRPKDFDYQTYLASREWAILREQVRKRSRNQCEHCHFAPQQAVHHLTYERIGQEVLRDLLAVCHPCHEFLSGKASVNPLDRWAVVTPPLQIASFVQLDYGPDHYLIPSADRIVTSEFQDKTLVFRVQAHSCRGAGCIWCGYQDPDWMIYFTDLVYGGYR